MTIAETPSDTTSGDQRFPLSPSLDLLRGFDKGDADGAFGPRHLVILGWRLHGPLDIDALRGALTDVVTRHEMLRTAIVRDESGGYQEVHPPSEPRLDVIDLPTDDPRPADERVDAFINEVENGMLPVTELPHLRAVVGRLNDEDAVLVLVTHHVASDGWSLHVVIRDLAAYYAARRGLGDADRPPMVQYREVTRRVHEDLAGQDADESRAYWRKRLAGAVTLGTPTTYRFSPQEETVYAVHRAVIGDDLTSAAVSMAGATRSSPFMVLLAACYALMHKITGSEDVVLPIITSGRAEPAFNETVGPFFNLVPVRADLSRCRNFHGLVREVRTSCLEAYTHELPFGEIAAQVPELNQTYARDDVAVIGFQVMQFPGMMTDEPIGDLRYTQVRRRTQSCERTSDIPNGLLWGLDILPTGETASTLRFNSKQFDMSAIEDLVDGYQTVLRNATTDPNAPLSAL